MLIYLLGFWQNEKAKNILRLGTNQIYSTS